MKGKLCLLFVRKSTKDNLYLPCFTSINQLTDVVDMVACGNIKVNISCFLLSVSLFMRADYINEIPVCFISEMETVPKWIVANDHYFGFRKFYYR